MKLEWINDEKLPSVILEKMNKAADQCLRAEGIQVPCAASVTLCNDEDIKLINASQRGIPHSTDVLSFPTINFPNGRTAGSCGNLLRKEYDDEMNACYLGDIVISVPHLLVQAKEYGHSVEREAVYLLVHGICHLMGYDHINNSDQIKMRSLEKKILCSISVFRDS